MINASTIKPLDKETLRRVFEKGAPVVTLEEHVLQGGFGSAVLEWAAQNRMTTPVSVMAVEDRFIQHGDHKHLLAEKGVNAIETGNNCLYLERIG